jgi:ubiquinone/menaquinone biosynthesis C-methylase UbiE
VSFDAIAPHYHWLESLAAGEKLQRARAAFLREVRDCHSVLIVGEGDGRFLAACAAAIPGAHFTVIDASRRMLGLARERWLRAGGRPDRVSFLNLSLPGCELPRESFDLIVTHFFLDCFPRGLLEEVVEMLAAVASPLSIWLLADFAVPSRGPARWRAQVALALAYAFFRVATKLRAGELVPPDEALRSHGFTLKDRSVTEWGLLHTDCWVRE